MEIDHEEDINKIRNFVPKVCKCGNDSWAKISMDHYPEFRDYIKTMNPAQSLINVLRYVEQEGTDIWGLTLEVVQKCLPRLLRGHLDKPERDKWEKV